MADLFRTIEKPEEARQIAPGPLPAMLQARDLLNNGDLEAAADLLRLAAAMMTGAIAKAH